MGKLFYRFFATLCLSVALPHWSFAQNDVDAQTLNRGMEATVARSDEFTRKTERRTTRAERRMARYENKLKRMESAAAEKTKKTADRPKAATKKDNGKKSPSVPDSLHMKNDNASVRVNVKGLQPNRPKAGREPSLNETQLAYGFAQSTGQSSVGKAAAEVRRSVGKAEDQLDASVRTKAEMRRKTKQWKEKAKNHPEYARTVGKMEKERYYYSAQINEYKKALRTPSGIEEKVTSALRKDPRFADYLAVLPAAKQDPEKMQPKNLVKDMLQSQAAAVDPDAAKLIADAKKKSDDLLGGLSKDAAEFGNTDNAADVPDFVPNPYRTKSIPERIDIGVDLEFEGKTYFLPACGVLGLRATFNFDPKWTAGISGNYRFSPGDIKHIEFSNMGGGYGLFAGYVVWNGFGVQTACERNYCTAVQTVEGQTFGAGWTWALLLGITKEYRIGKKSKGTIAVCYDFLHKNHMPPTNAFIWRTGWKF